ncbi:SRPBCC family protein [Phytoactinopolyspora halotolerans]|uniref:SRPBCC family protein n=1 Tax=Phytoactinopolyspora halotolerans TaxID=1981512 RepID=A0A6L9SCH4_9ACTN|nr:SRPBCC family protein [Phytoactinopolyspora halotolerans]NEE02292.1 SRPBCC family protein [Phytoactinopolyspora halotolerans]
MNRTPSGRLFRTADGVDLTLTRTFRASADDVWASVTEPERTARWFGPWKGDAGPGRTVQVQMSFEEDASWSDLYIDACEPPTRLAVSMNDEAGTWHMELLITETEADDTTELRLIQHLTSAEGLGEIGPGWEYYLDKLVAARDGIPQPEFTEYYPAMKPYFDELTAETIS